MNFASKLRQLAVTGISRPVFLPVLIALCGASIQADDTNQDRSLLTLDRIFAKREFKAEDWGPARWLKDGSGYTTLEKSEKTKDAKDVVRYEPASGKREVIIAASALVPPGATKPLRIEDYAWSDDSSKLLLFTNSKRVWRKNTRGDYWVYDLKTGKLQKLGGKAPVSSLMFAAFSPDGLKVGYVCQNNICVQDLKTLRIKQLTDDGSETIINGTSDWVYEEEFRLRDCFRWSPDSKYIAYWQFDTSGVRQFSLINNTDGPYPQVTSFAYPKAGETNSACRVGIVKATGGRTRWFRTNPDPRNHYIPELDLETRFTGHRLSTDEPTAEHQSAYSGRSQRQHPRLVRRPRRHLGGSRRGMALARRRQTHVVVKRARWVATSLLSILHQRRYHTANAG